MTPIRVAFFTQGVRTPSARFRVEQLLPSLAERAIDSTILPASPSNQGELARYAPPPGLRREVLRAAAVPARIAQLRHYRDHDVAFIQKPLIFYPTSVLERWLSKRLPTVFDVDDAIHLKHAGLGRHHLRGIVDTVERVIVGNAHLAEVVDRPEKVTIIPTVVDSSRYTLRPDPERPFTIGWTGLSHNLAELEPLVPVLKSVLRETGGKLLLLSERFDAPWIRELPVEAMSWSPENEVAALGAVHVGLMPLRDTPFNRGKCGFKLIQYMARGIPSIAPPVGANREILRDGVDGFLANDLGEWRDALMALARAPERRAAMGRAARARVEERYSVSAVTPKYVELFRRLAV